MPSQFQKKWTEKRVKLDQHMAEQVTIMHVERGDFIGVDPSPTDPPFFAIGICIIEDILAMAGAVLTGTADRTDVIISDPSITFMAREFGPGRALPRAGTRIIRSSWTTVDTGGAEPVFTRTFQVISPPLVDSVGQITCRLVPILEEESV